MIKIIMIIGVILMWFTSMTVSTYAITNSTIYVNTPLDSQIRDLRINPYFAPDESCDFNTEQLQCIPGEDQQCPKEFSKNEDGECHLPGPCPEGYHAEAENESGECYPDTEPCYPEQVRNQTDPNNRTCSEETIVCEDKNYNETACVRIDDYPTGSCLQNPDQDRCNILNSNVAYGALCPDTYVVMRSANFSTPKCVPDDLDELEFEERTRQVYDPNRCARGYELNVPKDTNIWRTGYPIGTCNKAD